jgi:hypothetical protein
MSHVYRALASVFPTDRISDDDAVVAGYAPDSPIALGGKMWDCAQRQRSKP